MVKKKKRKESEKTRRMERPVKRVQFGGRYLEPVFSSLKKNNLANFFFFIIVSFKCIRFLYAIIYAEKEKRKKERRRTFKVMDIMASPLQFGGGRRE